MRRTRRPSLRGSVSQSSGSVRVRTDELTRLGLLVRVAIAGGFVLILALFGLWGWHSGWFRQQANGLEASVLRLTQRMHFAVSDIIIEGRQQTGKEQLAAALEAAAGSPIFAFHPAEAEARIAKLPWVDTAIVERRLPDTIFVHLNERAPLARWQRDNRVTVIDTHGKPLPDANPDQFGQLPLLVGAGAASEGKALLESLRSFPSVDQRVTAAVRVGERRWDLRLQPKVVARLPESGVADALKRLSVLITDQKILDRDIVAIDLRLPDRLIIESGSAAAPAHPANGDNRL